LYELGIHARQKLASAAHRNQMTNFRDIGLSIVQCISCSTKRQRYRFTLVDGHSLSCSWNCLKRLLREVTAVFSFFQQIRLTGIAILHTALLEQSFRPTRGVRVVS